WSLGGDQHLVEVGQLERVLAELPAPARRRQAGERLELVGGRGDPARRARPRGCRGGLDLVVGATGLHRTGVVLRVPAGYRVVVVLVDQQPLLALAGWTPAHERE